MKKDGKSSELNLNSLIQKLAEFYRRFGFNPVPTPNIDQYRKRILNPSSHNDSKAKVFRSELTVAIKEIARLEKIQKYALCKPDDISTRLFVIEVEHSGKHVKVEFVPKEIWHKIEYDDKTYYEEIGIEWKDLVGIKLKLDKEHTTISIWKKVCKFVGYDDEESYPPLIEMIREKSTGILLKDLPIV